MLEDDKAPSNEQRHQIAAGQYMALSAAVHALIATHPDRAAFAKALDGYASETAPIFLSQPALQADDGIRQAYAEVLRGLRHAATQR